MDNGFKKKKTKGCDNRHKFTEDNLTKKFQIYCNRFLIDFSSFLCNNTYLLVVHMLLL